MDVFSMLTAYEKIGRFNVDNLLGIPYLNHMLRRARIDPPGALHHLLIRGIEGKAIFKERTGKILSRGSRVCCRRRLRPDMLGLDDQPRASASAHGHR